MTATQRMAYYASRLPLVEIDTSYRFPPTPEVCRTWVERTPDGFTIDLVAWSLLTGAATMPDSLWPDLQDDVRPDLRDRRRLYPQHLSRPAWQACWERFRHAVEPLRAAGRLGVVMLRYPHWLKPGETAFRLLAEARERLPDLPLAADLPNPRWLEGDQCDTTLGWLEGLEIALVCVDDERAETHEPVVAATADVAVVRFEGRNPGVWVGDDEDVAWGERFAHRYTTDELLPWVPRLRELSTGARVHAIFANRWRDDAVDGAERLARMLDHDPTGKPA